jgi:uncharacterized secreted protein with C-terminal beta-propeller domain
MGTTGARQGRRWGLGASLVAVGLVAAGVVAGPALSGGQPAAAASLEPFEDCGQLDEWFTAEALEHVGPYGFVQGTPVDTGGSWLSRLLGDGDSTVAGSAEAGAAVPDAAVGPGATGTNVQEAGVDEPDLVKTDGHLVVAVTADALSVAEVTGDALRRRGRLALADQQAAELLLAGDRAVVVGRREPAGAPSAPTTVLTVVDLADPTRPRTVRTEEVEGGYLSARLSAGAVRVVLQSVPQLPFTTPQPFDDGRVDLDGAAEANEDLVRRADASDWLPQLVVRDSAGSVVRTEPLLGCSDVAHPADRSGLGLVTVLTLDAGVSAMTTTDATAVAADGDLVYASDDRLYVATARGGWAAAAAEPAVMPGRSFGAIAPVADAGTTQLHAFDASDPAATPYVASGDVPGWLLGRWAMSERDGLLRVATTGVGAQGGQESGVTVLAERGDRLEPVGSVGGLGRGEQIRAVRWFDDLAVVVTFRQTDPLYTVDLSDPQAPRMLGELKIPGYSAYLHPLGDGLLLGVGQDATDTGGVLGTQVSTFDLGDLTAPRRLATLGWRQAWSDVEGESRAFTYLPERRLALLPISGTRGSGVVAVAVGADGSLSEAGDWTPDGFGAYVLRAVPVAGNAVVALAEASSGRSLTLLRTPDLAPLGAPLPLP